jgi:hypothetical protein
MTPPNIDEIELADRVVDVSWIWATPEPKPEPEEQ